MEREETGPEGQNNKWKSAAVERSGDLKDVLETWDRGSSHESVCAILTQISNSEDESMNRTPPVARQKA